MYLQKIYAWVGIFAILSVWPATGRINAAENVTVKPAIYRPTNAGQGAVSIQPVRYGVGGYRGYGGGYRGFGGYRGYGGWGGRYGGYYRPYGFGGYYGHSFYSPYGYGYGGGLGYGYGGYGYGYPGYGYGYGYGYPGVGIGIW